MPSTNRPPLMSSSAAACFARRPAERSEARVTSVPILTRVVTAAIAASVAYASSDGRSDGARGGKKWSNAKSPSNPSSSAWRANASTRSASLDDIGRTSPIRSRAHERTRPSSSSARVAAPTAPASLPSCAATIGTRGRCSGALDRVDERRARGFEQQVAGDDRPAADDDDLRVQDVHEPRDPLARAGARPRPARAIAASSPSCAASVTSRPVTFSGSPPASSTQARMLMLARGLAAHPVDRAARRHLLPAPEVAAPAQRAARLDDDVADLGREPVRAAEQPAVGDDPAADPGPDGDEQQVPVPASRAEAELAVGGHARVVVHLARQPERLAHPRARSARSRHARFGAKRSTPSAASTIPALPTPTATTSVGRAIARARSTIVSSVASSSSAGVGMFLRIEDLAVPGDPERVDLRARRRRCRSPRRLPPTRPVATRSRSSRGPATRSGWRPSTVVRRGRPRPARAARKNSRAASSSARARRARPPARPSPPCRSGRRRRCRRAVRRRQRSRRGHLGIPAVVRPRLRGSSSVSATRAPPRLGAPGGRRAKAISS